VKFHALGQTQAGHLRKKNDDTFLIDESLGLYIVCDGVSGQNSGEVASKLATQRLRQEVIHISPLLERCKENPDPEIRKKIRQALSEAIQAASREIFEQSQLLAKYQGMATTLDALIVAGQYAFLGHVGDGRAYLLREKALHQLTKDHNAAAELQNPEGPFSNILTRALGVKGYLEVDTLEIEVAPGDTFLLCTDGVYQYFEAKEFAQELHQKSLETIISSIEQKSLDRGGADNLTHLVIRAENLNTQEQKQQTLIKMKTLRSAPLFHFLSYPELMKLLSIATHRKTEKDTVLFAEGAPSNEMLLLLEGSVDILKKNQKIGTRDAGTVLGEMGIIEEQPRSATLIASTACSFLVFSREKLFPFFRSEPEVALKVTWMLCREVSQRLRIATEEVLKKQKDETEILTTPEELPFN
jgi:PPM family protein phosphatase